MPQFKISRSVPVKKTPRVQQATGMFDVKYEERSKQEWVFDFDLPAEWNVGLIVGPSGSGKSTVAREIFGDRLVTGFDWPADLSVLDGFPKALGIKEVIELLSSVGFSTPPAWVRPYHVLSNGEKFRVDLARTLAEMPDLAVVDEFTSVVDRQVAQVGSAAVAKSVRRRGARLVAVSCHYDVLDWLDPDWVFQPHLGQLERRLLQGRPKVELEVYAADRHAWKLFEPHHYLSSSLHTASTSFVMTLGGRAVAFNSYLHLPHPQVRDIKIGHRLVVLPDYQGLGIGRRCEEWLGQHLADRGLRYHNVTAHPALIAYCSKSPRWRICSKGTGHKTGPTTRSEHGTRASTHLTRKQGQARRLSTFSFEYVPIRKAVACSGPTAAVRSTASG